jgi:hypothetical protein
MSTYIYYVYIIYYNNSYYYNTNTTLILVNSCKLGTGSYYFYKNKFT